MPEKTETKSEEKNKPETKTEAKTELKTKAETGKPEKTEKLEREYVIPLRKEWRKVPRYRRTSKAVKAIKEFLVRHMKIRDRDLDKIKLDRFLNEDLWTRGIRNPPNKIAVKVVKEGEIVRAEDFPEARKPAYKLTLDFGAEIGIKNSSVQITKHYSKEELIGKLVIGVVNFPPKQIGPFVSEILTLGLPDENGDVVLLSPTKGVPKGGKMF